MKCPICKIEFLKNGLRNHIINTAKGEFFRGEKTSHKDFFDKHAKIMPDGKKTLKYTKL